MLDFGLAWHGCSPDEVEQPTMCTTELAWIREGRAEPTPDLGYLKSAPCRLPQHRGIMTAVVEGVRLGLNDTLLLAIPASKADKYGKTKRRSRDCTTANRTEKVM